MSTARKLRPVEQHLSDQDIEKKLAQKREQTSNDRAAEEAKRKAATYRIVYCYLCDRPIQCPGYTRTDIGGDKKGEPDQFHYPHEVWGMTHPGCEEEFKQCFM